jgi:hypothetical protein
MFHRLLLHRRFVLTAFVLMLVTAVICYAWIPGRMTGGGSFFLGDTRITHGFELHCSVHTENGGITTPGPNNLQVNWDQNRFHLETLISGDCWCDPRYDPAPPIAPFNTYIGVGTGRLNGVSGASVNFEFTDQGQPGTSDTAKIRITDPEGNLVLSTGYIFLTNGNQQAHFSGPPDRSLACPANSARNR